MRSSLARQARPDECTSGRSTHPLHADVRIRARRRAERGPTRGSAAEVRTLPYLWSPGNGPDVSENRPAASRPSACDVTERFTLALLPPVLVLSWAPGLFIDRSDILLARSTINSLGCSGLPLLMELSQPLGLTRDARHEVLQCEHGARVALLGSDAVDRVLTAFAANSQADLHFFTDRDEAELWLLQG